MNVIELRNITKTYCLGKIEVPVLHGVSLTVAEGEFVAIMGHSGSGKSTLLNILGLLDKPTSGEFLLNGRDVAKLDDDDLAGLRNRFMGFVFQQFNLLPRMTARENVLLPLVYSGRKPEHADPDGLLRRVGLGDRTAHRPNELSGGQQQRVAIARSLINNPLLIFADEPTGNLDSRSSEDIMELLKELNAAGMTIIMVTHENDVAAAAKRIVRLHDGRVVSDELTAVAASACPEAGCARTGAPEHHAVAGLPRVLDYFRQALRSLLSNKTRSALSILGVLIGVASLIAMMALGKGAQDEVSRRISSLGSNLLSVRPASQRSGGIALESGQAVRLTLEDVQRLRERVPGVARLAAYVSGRGQVTGNGKNWNTSIEGTTSQYPAVRSSEPSEGRFFTDEETVTRARVAVIGTTVATELFGERSPIGEYIKIRRVDFQVIGVLPDKGSSGWRDENDRIVVPLNTAMYRLLGKENVDYIDVQVADAAMMDETSERIKRLLAAAHRLPADKTDAINVRNMADIQETISSTTKAFSYLLGGIAFISLLVGGIGIMNIMLVSVTERTREIGLRKAIGANTHDILFQFVVESVVVCVLGGLSGIALGVGASVVLSKLAQWSTSVSPASMLLAFTFSVLVGLIFGVWPARKASQLNPIEALRYE